MDSTALPLSSVFFMAEGDEIILHSLVGIIRFSGTEPFRIFFGRLEMG